MDPITRLNYSMDPEICRKTSSQIYSLTKLTCLQGSVSYHSTLKDISAILIQLDLTDNPIKALLMRVSWWIPWWNEQATIKYSILSIPCPQVTIKARRKLNEGKAWALSTSKTVCFVVSHYIYRGEIEEYVDCVKFGVSCCLSHCT